MTGGSIRAVVATLLILAGGLAITLRPTHAMKAIDASAFSADALVRAPEIVDCTLDNGASAQCVRLVVKHLPDSKTIGPFCPATIEEVGGLWQWDGANAGLYRMDGAFLRMLKTLGYSFYEPDGTVHIADPARGRPSVDHACLEATLDKTVTMTMLIPQTPVMARTPTRMGVVSKVGVALDGVPIFSDAPSVLQTGHMPALDTCGGHVDPGGWYHWHATATDIGAVADRVRLAVDCTVTQAPDAMFGYAFDGFPLYGSADAGHVVPKDLDTCGGHVSPTRQDPTASYHYHAPQEFPNLPPCLSGVQARGNFTTTAKTGIGSAGGGGPRGPGGRGGPGGGPGRAGGPGRGGPPPGFADAAKKLGVTEEALMNAVREHGGPRLNFADAAKALGVTADRVTSAVVGKWHLASDANGWEDHPSRMGIGHYMGLLSGGAPSYTRWSRTENRRTETSTAYITSALTDEAMRWTAQQTTPWFLWLAYTAPHEPLHVPPAHLHSQTDLTGTPADIAARPQAYFFALAESMDRTGPPFTAGPFAMSASS